MSALALGNKKVVYTILFRAATQTLLEIAADPKHLGATIGFLAILHTWTQKLLHHPHIHCVVPGGGLSPDGQWVSCREGFFLPVKVLSSLFRGKFLALLDAAAQNDLLRFSGSTSALCTPEGWRAFINDQRRKAWVVYAKPPFGSPEQVLKYLARYTHRVAISNSRILAVNDTHVTFRYRDRKRDNAMRTMTLTGPEFLRRFLLHVLPKGFVRIRHFGLLANRVRKDKLAACRALLGQPVVLTQIEPDDDPPITYDPAAPRLCPTCRTGQLIQLRPLPPTVRHPAHQQRAPPK